jgi:hypothetical protein
MQSSLTAAAPASDRLSNPTLPVLALVLLLALAVPPLLREFWLPYWEYTDQDLILAYNALLLNQGLPQEYFDHPGYVYFLALSAWYRWLHGLGLLSLSSLNGLPPLADAAAYDAAWTELIRAGRVFSMLLGSAAVLIFTATIRRLTGSGRIALLIGLGLVFSMGLNQQIRQMRTDFLSGIFALCVLCGGLLAARLQARATTSREQWAPVLLLLLVGLAAALSVATKLQGLFVCMALPALLILCGERSTARTGVGLPAVALLSLAAIAAGVPAVSLILDGIAGKAGSAFPYHDIGYHLSGLYQGLIALWAVACIAVYARVWRVPATTAIAGAAALGLGVALGLMSLWIVHDPRNVIAVANPLEHMFVFSSWRHGAALAAQDNVLNPTLASIVWDGILRTLAIRTIVLNPDRIPQTVVIEWAVLFGIAMAWRHRRNLLALRAGALILVAWGLESIFMLRGFQRAYSIYTEPLVLLAAAFLLHGFAAELAQPRRRRILAGVTILFLIAAQIWPVTYLLRRHPNPDLPCELTRTFYMPKIPGFPFCS